MSVRNPSSSEKVLPTETTVAPGLIQDGSTMPGLPTQETTQSAPETAALAASGVVVECTRVTVAPRSEAAEAKGAPRILLLPRTTTDFPSRSTPYLSRRVRQASTVTGLTELSQRMGVCLRG